EGFVLEPNDNNQYLHDICLCNSASGEVFYEGLGYVFIELIKFVKQDTELATDLDRWLYVLKNMSSMDKIPVYFRKPIFEKLFNVAEYSNLSKEEKTMYDASLKQKWDNKNVLDYAMKVAAEEAASKARVEARQEERINMALEMKKDGIPFEQIAKFTKLSIKEIEKLK